MEEGFAQPPEPLPAGERLTLIAVRDVRIFPDGRVVADIVGGGAGGEGIGQGVFVEEGERWRLEGTAGVSPATPTAATVTP